MFANMHCPTVELTTALQLGLQELCQNTVWRETLVVGKFGELSAKLPLAK